MKFIFKFNFDWFKYIFSKLNKKFIKNEKKTDKKLKFFAVLEMYRCNIEYKKNI